jgi:hypothetical protein
MSTTEFILINEKGEFFKKAPPSGFHPEEFKATRYVTRPSAKTIKTIENYYGVKLTVREVNS